MRNVPAIVLGLVAVLACPADALELKNGRAAYDPLGVPKQDNKFLPGDFFYYFYEVEDLHVDTKTGVARVVQTMELLDEKDKIVYSPPPGDMVVPLFGAHRMLSNVITVTGAQPPGKYTLRVTVKDKLVKDKTKGTKVLTYKFEVLKKQFGIVQPFDPSVAFMNMSLPVRFAVTGMARDPKTKLPDVEVSMYLLDKDKKPTVLKAVVNNVRDLHDPHAFDITKMPAIPVALELNLSRAGTFFIEIEATDRLAKKTQRLRLPLTVVDPSKYLKIGAAGD
jgi:hypothetical protein